MSGAYVFYCSRCKVDHAGECPPASDSFFGIHRSIAPNLAGDWIDSGKTSLLDAIKSLTDALAAGSYNAKPSTLHQCKHDGSCGCWGPVDGVKFDPDGTVTLSYKIQLQYPIRYIPLMFYLDGV